MTTELPKVSRNGRYTLAESARLMACDTRTLYKGTNKVNGRPYFRGDQLLRIWRATY